MGEINRENQTPWVCPKCGSERPAEDKFCMSCGVDQSGNEADGSDNVVFGKLPTKEEIEMAEAKQKGK